MCGYIEVEGSDKPKYSGRLFISLADSMVFNSRQLPSFVSNSFPHEIQIEDLGDPSGVSEIVRENNPITICPGCDEINHLFEHAWSINDLNDTTAACSVDFFEQRAHISLQAPEVRGVSAVVCILAEEIWKRVLLQKR